jgi:hypothetical protein
MGPGVHGQGHKEDIVDKRPKAKVWSRLTAASVWDFYEQLKMFIS